MTPIEDLLREALASTPTTSATTDPLGALDRRVRRARRRLAAGLGAGAAIIVAAVVVPLVVVGGGGPNSVRVVTPPATSPTPAPPGTTELWTGGVAWASTQPVGRRWLLYDGGEQGYHYVVRLSGKAESPIPVEDPADYMVAGDNVIWVVGDGGPQQAASRISAVDVRTGNVTTRTFSPGQHVSFGAVLSDYLFVDVSDASGAEVDALHLDGGQIKDFGSRSVPQAAEMVVAGGAIWVHSGDKLVQLFLSGRGVDPGVTVPWGTGQMFAPTLPRSGPDGVWAYDGTRLIGLMPSALSGCVSCAEGARVTVPGKPSSVVEARDGLYVAVPRAGLYYYSPDALGAGETPVTASIAGVQVITMMADPYGGVDYVDDQGNLIHWAPSNSG